MPGTDQLERNGYDDNGIQDSEPSFYRPQHTDDDEGLENTNTDDLDAEPTAKYPKGHPSNKDDGAAHDAASLGAGEANGGIGALANNAMAGEAGIGTPRWNMGNMAAAGTPAGRAARVLKAVLPKKKSSQGLLAGGGVFLGTISAFFIVTGPNIALNHFRELIQNKVSSLQTHQSVRYRRAKLSRLTDIFTTDGRRGGKIITEMERKGYKFAYEGRKVIGLTPPGASSSLINAGIGDHVSDFMENEHPLKSARWKTSRSDALFKRFGVSRTSVVAKTAVKAGEDADKAINKAVANDVLPGGVGEDVRTGPPPADETADEKTAREAKEQAVKDAQTTPDTSAGKVAKEIKETGVDIEDATSVSALERAAVPEIAEGVDDAVINAAEAAAKGTLGTRIWGGLKSFFNPTDILDNICTLKNRLRMSVMVSRNIRAVSMLKYAFTFIGAAEDVRRGNGNSGRVKQVMKRLMGVDKQGNNFASSPAYQFAVKGKYSKSGNGARKSKYGVDGTLSGPMKGIQDSTDNIPGTSKTQCGIIQNPVFQIASTVIVTFGKAILCVVSIGAGCAAEAGVEEAVKIGVIQTIKKSIAEGIEKIFTKEVAKSVVKNLAKSALTTLSFEGALALGQMYIQSVLAAPFTTQEKGGTLAGPLIGGGGTANKQRSLQAGMVPVTSDQYVQARQVYLAELKEEQKSKSFYARIMNYDNPDSLAYNMVDSVVFNYSSPATIVNGGTQFLAKAANPLNTLASVAKVIGGSAYAATDDEVTNDTYVLERGPQKGTDIAVDFAGNPLVVMRTDIEAIDPETNKADLITSGDIDPTTLQPISTAFKKHMENCVEGVDIISQIEFAEDLTPETDCMAKLQKTVQFKAHLAYLDLLDGLDAEFEPSSVAAGATTPSTGPTAPPTDPGTPAGPLDPSLDTSKVPCGAGEDLNAAPGSYTEGYINGVLHRIKLCKIQGKYKVNSQVSKGADDMFNAANAAGITLGASDSFRSMATQQAGFHQRCGANYPETQKYAKPPCTGAPIARPGYSNHQMGFAFDMMCGGGGVPQDYNTAKNNKCFIWLQANAAKYGYYEYGKGKESSRASKNYEGWHWSVDGN